jgi:hypothetical protein
MASGHVYRIKRPNTWLHRPTLQTCTKLLPTRSRPHMTQTRSATMSAIAPLRGQSGLGSGTAKPARRGLAYSLISAEPFGLPFVMQCRRRLARVVQN